MINETQLELTLIGILTQRDNQWTYRSDIKTEAAKRIFIIKRNESRARACSGMTE